jgi:hypothetical protein
MGQGLDPGRTYLHGSPGADRIIADALSVELDDDQD